MDLEEEKSNRTMFLKENLLYFSASPIYVRLREQSSSN